MEQIPVTKQGFDGLEAELKDLKTVQRPNVIEAIATAREHGDLSENAEYHAARERQSFIEGRIAELEDQTSRAEVIDPTKLDGDSVKFGATVTIADCETDEESVYQIVGEFEADLTKKKISVTSPMSRAMIGKSVGDVFEVNSPGGTRDYEVVAVKYA